MLALVYDTHWVYALQMMDDDDDDDGSWMMFLDLSEQAWLMAS
jgi:hypothetical protein